MDQIFSKDFDESMEYCDNLYNQIKDSNDLFDESLDNHELKDIDVVMENFNKFNFIHLPFSVSQRMQTFALYQHFQNRQ